MSDDPSYEEALERSKDLLREAVTRHGFLASPVRRKNYFAVWGRDGSICAAAAFLTGDKELIEAGLATVNTLAEHQADNGQVPSYLELNGDREIENIVTGGLGEITTIDANLWFIIACQTALDMEMDEFATERRMNVYNRVLGYLFCIDANSCGLLEIPTAGDWTDILTRSYHVLYDQALWYRTLKCAAALAEAAGHPDEDQRFEDAAQIVKRRLNEDFWWGDSDTIRRVCDKYKVKSQIDKERFRCYYQSHLEPFFNNWSHRFDAFANVLTCLMGVAPLDRAETVADLVCERRLHEPYPLRILDPPIEDGDEDAYQLRLSDEAPWDYHNGGIWPMAGGFWAILLKKLGREAEAHAALRGIARANRMARDGDPYEWGFYEYHHGKRHEPCGTPRLAWNAASYLIAHYGVLENRLACFARGGEF